MSKPGTKVIKFMRAEDFIKRLEDEAKAEKKADDTAAEDELSDELFNSLGAMLDLSEYDDISDNLKAHIYSDIMLTDSKGYDHPVYKEGYYKGLVLTIIGLARKVEKLELQLSKVTNKLTN